MKKETYNNKLADIVAEFAHLAGHTEEEVRETKKKVSNKKGNIRGISEEEIQKFREAQGVVYFLQAPELFHARVCKRCGEPFLVSRLHVAYCSYLCIENSILDDYGIRWSRMDQIEADPEKFAQEVYEGNEPLWIRDLSTLQRMYTRLTEALLTLSPMSKFLSEEGMMLLNSSQTKQSPTAPSGFSTASIPTPRL